MPNPAQTWPTDADRKDLQGLRSVINRLRDLDPEMPIQQFATLVWVALNEDKTQRELCSDLNMPNSSASRNLAALSKVHRLGREGLGLVTWVESVEDRRMKLLMLTPKGRNVVQGLLEVL